ncbi:MAG: hypothetical protein JSS35_09125 [Proteobacteria bacterium]|nr:hypothetical protein [Pseudomonadota bacterium]
MALGLCAVLTGCATRPMPPPQSGTDVGRSFEAPFRDLSLVREVAPEVLTRAAMSPYDLGDVETCSGLSAEVARLDAALGPDLSPGPAAQGSTAEGLAGDLVSGAISLPFRSVVRRVSGAQAREVALRAAVLAGMVRRGFLKGRAGVLHCPLGAPPVSPP